MMRQLVCLILESMAYRLIKMATWPDPLVGPNGERIKITYILPGEDEDDGNS